MSRDHPKSIELRCPGCGARFKLKAQKKLPTRPVPCPKCDTKIPVVSESDGVRNMGLGDMFGRSAHRTKPRPAIPEPETSEAEDAPRRVFRDVTSVALDLEEPEKVAGASGKDTDPGLKARSEPRADHGEAAESDAVDGDGVENMPAAAVLRRADTTRIAAPRVPRAPEDKNVRNREDDGATANEESSAPSTPTPGEPEPAKSVLDDTMEVPQASPEIAQQFWDKMQPSWTIDEGKAALERGVRARVRDEQFGPLDLAGLKLLLRSDIWLGAVELEFEDRWLPMARHPLLPLIEEELRAEARDAMLLVTASTSAERPRPEKSPTAPERLPTPADTFEPDAEAPATKPMELPKPPLPEPEGQESVADEGKPTDESSPGPPLPPEIPPPLHEEDETATRENPAQAAIEPVEDSEASSHAESDRSEPDETVERAVEPAPSTSESNAAVEAEIEARPSRRDTPIGRIALILVILAGIATAGVLTYPQWKDFLPKQPVGPSVGQPTEALRLAFNTNTRASAIAGKFAALRERSNEELHDEIRDSVERADFGSALELVHELRRREPGSPELVALQARALSGAGEWSEARMVIIEAYAANPDPELKRLFARVVRVDPTLRDDVKTIGFDTNVEVIKALGGGRSISLKMKRDGENVFAFKPGQTEWEQGWRVEVAAWRFCEVASCDFDIPRSMSARISREDFEALYPMDSIKQRKYAERFEELVWINEPGPDGVERDYLYGVLKDWVPHFTDWPIEYTHVWEPWLNVDGSIEVLEQPFEQAIKPLAIYKDGEYFRQITKERGEATTRSVARQISNIMIFDYLTNNWDRFSTNEDYYGVNNQFADGRFVSIDNGACFHLQSSIRVDSRFEPVERMSSTFVASVRLLDRAWLDGMLFPNSSVEERLRLDVLWNRREQFLERVDTLVEKHGQDEVLVFR